MTHDPFHVVFHSPPIPVQPSPAETEGGVFKSYRQFPAETVV